MLYAKLGQKLDLFLVLLLTVHPGVIPPLINFKLIPPLGNLIWTLSRHTFEISSRCTFGTRDDV